MSIDVPFTDFSISDVNKYSRKNNIHSISSNSSFEKK